MNNTVITENTSCPDDLSEPCQAALLDFPCSIYGNDDIYGLGIRVSLYVQWYCTVLAYFYDIEKAVEFTVANYTFSIAVAIAAVVNREEIFKHEVIIIAVLMMVPPTVIVVSAIDHLVRWSEKSAELKRGKSYGPVKFLKDLAGLLATSFLLCVAVWELFDGVGLARRAVGATSTEGTKDCYPEFIKSFYLSNDNNTVSRYATALKAISIIFAILAPMFFLLLIFYRRKSSGNLAPAASGLSTKSKSSSKSKKGHVLNVRSGAALGWGLIASFVIAQTETIIKQNRIQGVMDIASAGQLIPLTVGIIQFCIITFHIAHKKVEDNKKAKAKTPAQTTLAATTAAPIPPSVAPPIAPPQTP